MRKLDGEKYDAVDSVPCCMGEMLSTEEEELTIRGSVGDVLDKVEDSLVAVLVNTYLVWIFMATNDLCNVDLVGCSPGKHVSGVDVQGEDLCNVDLVGCGAGKHLSGVEVHGH